MVILLSFGPTQSPAGASPLGQARLQAILEPSLAVATTSAL
jgi:hypothetical protein